MRLWWGQLISQFGDRIHQMALIGFIAERAPGSTWGLAKIFAFTIIPVFLVGPIAGVFVDRWDHRRTLFVCDLLRGLLVLTIPFLWMAGDSLIPIYLTVFLIFCCSRFYIPAKMSIIPSLVSKENLLVANSLMTTTGMIAFVMGASLGGLLVDHYGSRNGFVLDAMTFFVSASLIISIQKDFQLHIDKAFIIDTGKKIIQAERSLFAEIREGVRYLITHREIRFIMNIFFVLLAAAGAIYVVIIVFIQETFQSVTKDLGVLAVFLGLGLFSGAIAYGKWGQRFVWYRTIFFCLVLGGGMIIFFTTLVNHYPNLVLASGLSLVLGMVTGPIFIASNTVLHVVSDKQMRGKVFSALEVVIHFAFLSAMLLSSFLSEHIGEQWILIGVGALFVGVGIFGYVRYHRGEGLAIPGEKVA